MGFAGYVWAKTSQPKKGSEVIKKIICRPDWYTEEPF
jgi:hypothetical protein